ncbi:MAG TPA: hypothetical protein VJO14_07335 [Bacteroidota bacterium]|nr:hypothetical protein [Bacteroidota bacterium]
MRGPQGVNKTRLYIVGGAMAASMIGIHLYQESGWWKYNRAPFNFREDLVYGLSVDKIGHFYGTGLWAYSLRKILGWADLPDRTALYYGAAGAFLFQTFLEMEDGFSAWGFDRVDFLSDLGGALWPIAQAHSAFLRAFDLKLSYKPTSLLHKPAAGGFVGQKHLVMDDYEGQTFWLALKPADLTGGNALSFWPGFLNLAVGYGARDVSGVPGRPYSVVYVGFDYDMKKIIPQTSAFLVTLSEALNFIHFPAPAVRLSPTTIVYGVYY